MFRRNIFFVFVVVILLVSISYYYYTLTRGKEHFSFHGYDVEKADFFGISSEGNFYNIKADYIIKVGKKKYKMEKIYSKYYVDDKKEKYLELVSGTGIFNEFKNLLDLKDGVNISLSQGYRLITSNFYINIDKNLAYTNDEVLINGPQGKTLSKNGMTAYVNNKKIVFHGPIQSMFIEN